ncbi:NAD(P)H-binding protein [Streptomyces antibioticus]|uniref:NAD(P)H-binding protein n=1 Tax=Streptomyces antibioticus TaxID=1890 RepID=UPI0033B15947
MSLTVFGASGRTGQALLHLAHARGHRTTAHVRDAACLGDAPATGVVTGSVFDTVNTTDAVRDADAVVPDVVADAVARAVASDRPKARYAVGASARQAVLGRKILTDRALDRIVARVFKATPGQVL